MPVQGEYEPSAQDWVREQVELYESSGGTKGTTLTDTGIPVVVVTNLGASSGKVRKTPVKRVEHDGKYAMVASKGGAPEHPLWYHNIRANPRVELQDGPDKRDLLVDLHNHVTGALRRRERNVDARPQAHVPVGVGRSALQQAHVDLDGPRGKQLLDFAQEDRRVIGAPLLHRLAHVAADEQRVVPEVAFVLRKTVVGHPRSLHVDHLHILQFGAAPRQRLHQFHRPASRQ